MTFQTRIAAPSDAASVSSLLGRSYSALLPQAYSAELLNAALPLITKAQPKLLTSGTYYVAETDSGKLIGAGGWTKHSPTARDETPANGNIRHFGTDPEYTGKGVARALMTRCFEAARSAGLLELNCYSTLNAEAFYKSCGFMTKEPCMIELPGGVQFPSVRMEITL
ncbi:GNAT family N-acetyltransferase [Labrenzia sp. PHM005]|uniref:GNAT family N-acetyltransferase n=1 Tax=Labrenzia sp. PHM005 TaxID=2590016 RepID=UPI00143D771E|nr:GNAT family N-acetyltransferase [Labrenzia sp. PHM005]